MQTVSYDKLMEKWAPVLNEESAGAINDQHRKAVTAAILENQERLFVKSKAFFKRTYQPTQLQT